MHPFDGSMQPPCVKLTHIPVWVQIHNICPLYRVGQVVEGLPSRVGKVRAVEMATCVRCRFCESESQPRCRTSINVLCWPDTRRA